MARYSAVLLDDASHRKLIYGFESQIPDGWDVIAHHMTIKYPGITPEAKKDLGKTVTLTVTELGISDKAIAVKVTGYPSANRIPHITLAVNTENGGRPKDSNDIKNWTKVSQPITLTGVVSED